MEIELTAQAEADLVEIGDFIAKDNPSAAERYVRRLRDRIAVHLLGDGKLLKRAIESVSELHFTLSVSIPALAKSRATVAG